MRYFLAFVASAALAAGTARADHGPAGAEKPAQPAPVAPVAPVTKPADGAEIASLDALLARFGQIEGMRARYQEEKRIALLKRPLVSEGRIEFARPGLLLRKAERPEPAAVLLDRDNLRIADASGTRTIALQESPLVRNFVQTFVHVLSGDRNALDKLYKMSFAKGAGGGWRLELTPRTADLSRIVKRATLEGSGATVSQMMLEEENGDSTVLRFSDVDLNVHYDAATRARTFRLP
jgi:Outer membrane lipoprotein carrier protein LolA-like